MTNFQVPSITLPASESPSPPTPPCESPCQPPKYNEDEPEIVDDDEDRLTPIEDKVSSSATFSCYMRI